MSQRGSSEAGLFLQFVLRSQRWINTGQTPSAKRKLPAADADEITILLDELKRAVGVERHHHDKVCIVMSSIPEATVQERIRHYAAFVRKPFQLAAMIELVATILAAPKPEP